MNLRRAAEQALKYFEDAHGLEDTEVAIREALRQALAQQEQESVPNVWRDSDGFFWEARDGEWHSILDTEVPLYSRRTPKREWVGLSDEEKYDVLEGATGDGGRVYYDTLFRSYEAKLKEKNGG